MNFRPLICENGNDVSLGRTSFWLCFFCAALFWFVPGLGTAPASLVQLLYITATYNLAKKGVDVWKVSVENKKVEIEESYEDERPPRIP